MPVKPAPSASNKQLMETKFDDSVLGRARVQDTPELEAYYKELESLGAGALWTVANDIEPWEPRDRKSVV